MILFCLPYAGGSAYMYNSWRNYLTPTIRLYPIELKGRGSRFGESFYENIEEAVDDILFNIENAILDNEYSIFGHSMGSLLAYELYHKISSKGLRKPKHIFFSGSKAPEMRRGKEIIYSLPDYEFIDRITKLGGTPKEILEDEELLELVIPILKNDFRITETYDYKKRGNKIECDISILCGKQDSIKLDEIEPWKNHTDKNCSFYFFEGGHFFVNDKLEDIIHILSNIID